VFPGFNDVGVTSHRWEISGFGDDLRYLRTQVWKLRKKAQTVDLDDELFSIP